MSSRRRGWERWRAAAEAATAALSDPTRDDAVAVLGETTGTLALEGMRNRMMQSDSGREILRDRPIVTETEIPLERWRRAETGSLGYAYAAFMDRHGFHPDERKAVRFVEDEELAYVMRRYREMHDFWHVLLRIPPDVKGELALKWFELVQTGLPMNALAAVVGPLRLEPQQRIALWTVDVPWALRAGKRADFLMNVRVEDYLDQEIDGLRERWGIEVHPSAAPDAA